MPGPFVHIELVLGNQNYDAIVVDARTDTKKISYIEVTLVHEGYDAYLRMLHLHEKGYVSGLGEVKSKGTKRTGLHIEVEESMTSQKDVLAQESQLFEDALSRKAQKTYRDNTVLLLAYDDRMSFDRPDNLDNIRAIVNRHVPALSQFSSIAVIGLHQDTFLYWELYS